MSSSNLERIPELDGVRGVAILLVLATHIFKRANYFTNNQFLHWITEPVKIGWAGVDLFFVLSGFLITGILLRTREKPNYFKNFYIRRILRIFPLYYLVVGGLLLFLPALDADAGLQTQASWPVFMLYQQNWLYLSTPEPSLFLGLTWSLAIEEQFYLVWPAVVYFLNRRQLAITSASIIIFSLLVRIVMMFFQPALKDFIPVTEFFYYSTVTRFEGMALGAIIAIAFTSDTWKEKLSRWAGPLLPASLAAILVIVLTGSANPVSDNYLLATLGYSLLALASGTLVILVSTLAGDSILRRIFRHPGLVFFGKYSYAMYLLHMPLITILLDVMWDTGRQNAQMWLAYVVLSFGGTILLSLFSWHLLEKHILNLKRYFE